MSSEGQTIRETLKRGSYLPEAGGWQAFFDSKSRDQALQALTVLEARLAEAERALRLVADKQQHALKIIEDNGFVFDDIGKEPGNWKHLAFTLYSEICEIDTWARAALDIPLGEPAALPSESGTPDVAALGSKIPSWARHAGAKE